MDSIDLLFTEEKANEISQKVLNSVLASITEKINGEFRNETESFLYENYMNASDKIKGDLIKELADLFVKDPLQYKYKAIRDRIFEENREVIVNQLTEGAIYDMLNNIFWQNTQVTAPFHWKWKEGVVDIILKNWDTLKDDERIINSFGREISTLKRKITQLESQVLSLQETED